MVNYVKKYSVCFIGFGQIENAYRIFNYVSYYVKSDFIKKISLLGKSEFIDFSKKIIEYYKKIYPSIKRTYFSFDNYKKAIDKSDICIFYFNKLDKINKNFKNIIQYSLKNKKFFINLYDFCIY